MRTGTVIGPFTVGPIIGEGGMATVYSATHHIDESPVALKILRPEVAKQDAFLEAFGREVRAAAGLHHRRITAVFDHGVITASECEHQPELIGSPWLAMEIVTGGTISGLAGKIQWPQLQRILLEVLDGLAHAHARIMIHRDIKPGNVLFDASSGHIKVTDFGLVHSIDAEGTNGPDEGEFASGTPSYMAPEQINSTWRDYGPWTDLYSVGAMAWALATGRPPYTGELMSVFRQHMVGRLPIFDPTFPMPLGLLDWIEAMMQRKPYNRFRRAADAAWALSQIEAISHTGEPILQNPSDMLALSANNAHLDTLVLNGDADTLMAPIDATQILPKDIVSDLDQATVENDDRPEMVRMHPPFPAQWATPRRPRVHLHGAGLALFGLRATGIVGRKTERNRLWKALQDVVRDQTPQMVLIEGAAGSGKSALANWLCTRADEVGAAHWVSTSHTKDGNEVNGIEPILEPTFRIKGLPRDEAVTVVREHLRLLGAQDLEDAADLVRLAQPNAQTPDGSSLDTNFSSPEERQNLISRYLRLRTKRRPLIVWMDAIQRSPEATQTAVHLLKQTSAFPILILGTVQAGKVQTETDMERRLQTLLSQENTQKISLVPLPREAQFSLLQELLGLEPSLAANVVSQSGGNPQFAVQLVGDWVQRGILRPSESGFVLADGTDASIPNSMLEMWRQRLTEVCSHFLDEDTHALEIGAMLGNDIRRDELEDALALAKVQPSEALLSELQRTRLVVHRPRAEGWSFVHSLFRAAVLEYVEEKGRTKRWANVCADVLESRPQSMVRRARFLVAADRTEEALEPLKAAALEQTTIGEWGRARLLVELRDSILETIDVDPRGHHALGTELIRLVTLHEIPRNQALLAEGAELAEWANRLKDYDGLVRLKMGLGTARLNIGESESGIKLMFEALKIARKNRLRQTFAVLNRMCFTHIRIGELDKAANFAREAALTAESCGDTHGVANGYLMMGRVHWQAGRLDAATFCVTEAAIRFERTGCRRGLAEVWNTRGEIARSRGDLDEAELAYWEAFHRYDSCGSSIAEYAKLNLGNTYVDAKKFSEAKVLFAEVENTLLSAGRIPVTLVARLSKVPCLIHEKDWEAVESEMSEIGPKLIEVGLVDRDVVSAAQTVVDMCDTAKRTDLGRKASEILLHQLNSLGRTVEAAEVSKHLEASAGI